ncbi:hypothetical protein L596_009860 [Steinernema carpocapsae]|uniref:AXH domain-containing protein n=1 Tax=Steinernema carpocapsae TaxID=34508 RepID=A0A4U5PGK6_STECR|nr:hypothetical protein L596_009860 [Steinernema carpocapsae]
MSSHESVQKNGAQPRTSLAGAPQVFGGHGPQAAAISAAGNGGPHLASPAAPTAGIVQPAPMRLQPGFDVQLIAQLAQAASSSAFSAAGPPNAPGASDPQNSPQTPRVTPPVAVSNPSTAFSPFSGTSNSPASSSGTNMTTQQMISQYQVLLAMMQQQQQPQPRIPAFPTPQLDLRQMLILQQSQQMQQQQQQLQQLAALQQQHHHHQQQQQQQQQHLQQQQAAAALAAQQKPVQRHPVSSSIALQQQQQRNLADSTAMPPPPVPRRPMPTSVSLPPPQPSTSQPRTTPPHPQPLPSTSYQQPAPQPAPPRPQPVVNYRQRLQSIPEMGTMNAKPYYPTHFMRGTRIQLESGEQKNVEDLTAKDFHMSGAAAEGIDVELSRIEAIEKASEGNVQTAKVTLSAGEIKAKVTIQVYVEHPFFIIGVGWASINPTLAKARFGLDCKNLAVGHECISLVKAEDKRQYVMNHNGDEKGQRRASLPTNLSPNGNGSTHKASTSSDGSPALIRSDLRARIKTYQRTRSPSLSSVSQKSTVIRRPRRHRSEPPADLFEIKKRSFSRKRRTRGRAASETCLMDLIGPF